MTTLLEQVCRKIYETHRVVTDESWRGTWNFHTNPEHVKNGGQWEVLTKAQEIIDLIKPVDGDAPVLTLFVPPEVSEVEWAGIIERWRRLNAGPSALLAMPR